MPEMTNNAWEVMASYIQTLLVSKPKKMRKLFEAIPLKVLQEFRTGLITIHDEYTNNKVARIVAASDDNDAILADDKLLVNPPVVEPPPEPPAEPTIGDEGIPY